MRPEDVGLAGTELVLGKHSGRHAFSHKLQRMGISLSSEETERAYQRFIALADKKKHVYDDDLLMIAREEMVEASRSYILDYLHVSTGSDTVPTATVRIRQGDDVTQDAACGDGPVDAALKTIDRITGIQGRLLDFSLQAVTVGKDALGEVSLRVRFGEHVISGKSASTDIVEASAKAYLSCVNRHVTECAAAKPTSNKKATKKKASKKKTTAPRSRSKKKASSRKKSR